METSGPLDPVTIENAIRELVTRIAKGIKICDQRYRVFLEADRAFDREWAQAYLTADGTVEDRKQQAVLETMGAREEREIAEAGWRHADRLAKALEVELRAYQSLGASTRAMYQVAGRGET